MIRFILAHVELWTRPIPVNYCSLLRHMVANDCWHFHPAKHQQDMFPCSVTSTHQLALLQTSQSNTPSVLFKTPASGGITCSTNVLERTLSRRFQKEKPDIPKAKKHISTALNFRPLLLVSQESVYHRRCSLMIWGYSRAKNHPHVNVIPPFVAKPVAMWWWGYLWDRWSSLHHFNGFFWFCILAGE